MLRDILQVNRTIIPKEGKDQAVCSSFRTILLLNINLKIFTKILASRITQYIASLIHPDLVGLYKGGKAGIIYEYSMQSITFVG